MKVFEFKIIIREGRDEFWEELREHEDHGIKAIKQSLEDIIGDAGYIDVEVVLQKYTYEKDEWHPGYP